MLGVLRAPPRYVDVVLDASPDASAAELPQVAHHIEQCPECAEAYRALLEIARRSVRFAPLPHPSRLKEG